MACACLNHLDVIFVLYHLQMGPANTKIPVRRQFKNYTALACFLVGQFYIISSSRVSQKFQSAKTLNEETLHNDVGLNDIKISLVRHLSSQNSTD